MSCGRRHAWRLPQNQIHFQAFPSCGDEYTNTTPGRHSPMGLSPRSIFNIKEQGQSCVLSSLTSNKPPVWRPGGRSALEGPWDSPTEGTAVAPSTHARSPVPSFSEAQGREKGHDQMAAGWHSPKSHCSKGRGSRISGRCFAAFAMQQRVREHH